MLNYIENLIIAYPHKTADICKTKGVRVLEIVLTFNGKSSLLILRKINCSFH